MYRSSGQRLPNGQRSATAERYRRRGCAQVLIVVVAAVVVVVISTVVNPFLIAVVLHGLAVVAVVAVIVAAAVRLVVRIAIEGGRRRRRCSRRFGHRRWSRSGRFLLLLVCVLWLMACVCVFKFGGFQIGLGEWGGGGEGGTQKGHTIR